jgi:hypothetical protein
MMGKRMLVVTTLAICVVLGALNASAESYTNINGLLVYTEDSPVNDEFDSWSYISIPNTFHKLVVTARAWQYQGLFGDICVDDDVQSCKNCSDLIQTPATVTDINLSGMYYTAQHKSKVFSTSSVIKDYTSVGGTHSSQFHWWGGYAYNPTC